MQRHILGDGVVLTLAPTCEEFEWCFPVRQTMPVLPCRHIRIAIDKTIDGFELCHQRQAVNSGDEFAPCLRLAAALADTDANHRVLQFLSGARHITSVQRGNPAVLPPNTMSA